MRKLLLLLYLIIAPLLVAGQSVNNATYISVKDGDASDPATWGIFLNSTISQSILESRSFVINHKVDFNFTSFSSPWGKKIMINPGGEMWFAGNATFIGSDFLIISDELALPPKIGKLTVTGNLTIDNKKSEVEFFRTEGGSLIEVGGNFLIRNSARVVLGSNNQLNVSGDLVVTGGGTQLRALDGHPSVPKEIGRDFIISGDAKVDIGDESIWNVQRNLSVTGGKTVMNLGTGDISKIKTVMTVDSLIFSGSAEINVNHADLIVNSGANIYNGGTNLVITNQGYVEFNGNVRQYNSALIRVTGSELVINGNYENFDGGTRLIVEGDGKFLVSGGDVMIRSNGRIDLFSGQMVVQSVETIDGSGNPVYTGGNVTIKDWTSRLVIRDGAQLAILGNKAYGILPGDPDVEGNLTLGIGAYLDLQPNGSLLVYNDIILTFPSSQQWNYFFNSSVPIPSGTPVLIFLGGITCDYWQGPGFVCRDGDVTLPVELLSFEAVTDGREVTLKWQTATELNNDYFTVERSSDGVNFERIGKVMGNGTTKESKSYTFKDRTPLPGMGYYRLSQTDYDGSHEVLGTRAVNFLPGESGLNAYPNPLYDDVLTLRISGLEANREALIRIIDPAGRTVYQENLDTGSGHLIRELNLEGRLERGMYLINVIQGNRRFTGKLSKM